MSGYVSDSVAAIGTASVGAYVINRNSSFINVTTCTSANNAVRLPSDAKTGTKFLIKNSGINLMQIFPMTGGTINSLAANVAFTLGPRRVIEIVIASALSAFTFQDVTPSETVMAVDDDIALTTADSGSTIAITQGVAALTISLPAVANTGTRYDFVITATAGGDVDITATTACMRGILATSDNNPAHCVAVACAGVTTISFVGGTCDVGDKLSIVSDGTSWCVRGFTAGNVGFAVA